MDIIHCNACNALYGEPWNHQFILTNCGHMFCVSCNEIMNKECTVCHRSFEFIPIEPGNEELAMYFENPAIEIGKQLDIFEFQQLHRNNLLEHLKEIHSNFDNLQKENQDHALENSKLKDELNAKCLEIKHLKKELAEYRQRIASTNSQADQSNKTVFGEMFNKCSETFSQLFERYSMTATNSGKPMPKAVENNSPLGTENIVSSRSTYRNSSTVPSSDRAGVHSPLLSPPSSPKRKNEKGLSPVRDRLRRLSVRSKNPPRSTVVKASSKIKRP